MCLSVCPHVFVCLRNACMHSLCCACVLHHSNAKNMRASTQGQYVWLLLMCMFVNACCICACKCVIEHVCRVLIGRCVFSSFFEMNTDLVLVPVLVCFRDKDAARCRYLRCVCLCLYVDMYMFEGVLCWCRVKCEYFQYLCDDSFVLLLHRVSKSTSQQVNNATIKDTRGKIQAPLLF